MQSWSTYVGQTKVWPGGTPTEGYMEAICDIDGNKLNAYMLSS